MWIQRQIRLRARSRGFHLVTEEVICELPEIGRINTGLLHIFIQHTSASLTINENADPSVRVDFESIFNQLVPEGQSYYEHVDEGPDDMPAHVKASMLGSSITIPVNNGLLGLGTWQGIYLGEHRNYGGQRRLLLTLNGE